jgi:alpha-glucan, water dikinase
VDESTRFRRLFKLADGEDLLVVVSGQQPGDIGAAADNGAASDAPVTVTLTTSSPNDLVMHWGVTKTNDRSWTLPPKALWTSVPGSVVDAGGAPLQRRTRPQQACVRGARSSRTHACAQRQCTERACAGKAIETPFQAREAAEGEPAPSTKLPLQSLQFAMPSDSEVVSLVFVMRSGDRSAWYRDGSQNFIVPLMRRGAAAPSDTPMDALLQSIVDAENSDKWTLMHRFNAAAGVLDEIMQGAHEDVPRAAAAAYVWLRYSATRALTWQRNYNTQPRQLSAAQGHLTNKIAEVHASTSGETQEWVRLALGTVGRGGDGQAIRDEILHIMHRNHIPELKGTWMEEWHQKLHNNTTPDDVPICKAYLAFLRANGDNGAYWRVLSDAGISRARLESFDRPIRQVRAPSPNTSSAVFRHRLPYQNAPCWFPNYWHVCSGVTLQRCTTQPLPSVRLLYDWSCICCKRSCICCKRNPRAGACGLPGQAGRADPRL